MAVGYYKKLKIFDIKRLIKNKTKLHPIFDKEISKEVINILNWHSSQNFLIAGSSIEKKINIYSVKEKIELLTSIFLPNYEDANESDDKLLDCLFILGNGIIIIKEKKAFIFNSTNNYAEMYLDQIYVFENPVTNFKWMTTNVNNHYFVYTDKIKNFNVRKFEVSDIIYNSFIETDLNSIQPSKISFYFKEIENVN